MTSNPTHICRTCSSAWSTDTRSTVSTNCCRGRGKPEILSRAERSARPGRLRRRAHRRRVQDRLSGRRSVAAHVGMGLAGRRHRHSSVVQDRSGHRQDNVLPAFHGLHQSSSAAADLLGRQGDAGWRLNGLPNVMRERREACVPWRSARRRACRRRAADRRRPCRPATSRA